MTEVVEQVGGPRAAPVNPLQGRTFVTDMTLEDDIATPVVDGTTIRLSFRAGHLGAHAGCNSIDLPLRVDPDRLCTGEAIRSLVQCDADRMAQEAWLIGFLESDPEWTLSSDSLLLRSGHERLELTEEFNGFPTLLGRTFRSLSVTGTPRPLVPGTTIVLTFPEVGDLLVEAGCNLMVASYDTGGDAGLLVAPPQPITRMACSPELAEQDAWFAEFLADNPFSLSLLGNTLTLAAGQAELVLTEVPVADDAPPSLPWGRTFEAVVPENRTPLVAGSTITFAFGEPGTVSVQAGCNTLGFGVRLEDGRLVVDDEVSSTDMACEREMEAQDEWLMAYLTGDPWFSIIRGVLTLTRDGESLALLEAR